MFLETHTKLDSYMLQVLAIICMMIVHVQSGVVFVIYTVGKTCKASSIWVHMKFMNITLQCVDLLKLFYSVLPLYKLDILPTLLVHPSHVEPFD